MVAPTTSYPASTKSAAATDESTPPDIATSTRSATGSPHPVARRHVCTFPAGPVLWRATRSEEHTSELQSQSNLVCRLLLEKKKNKNKVDTHRDSPAPLH